MARGSQRSSATIISKAGVLERQGNVIRFHPNDIQMIEHPTHGARMIFPYPPAPQSFRIRMGRPRIAC